MPSVIEMQRVTQSMINEANNWYILSRRCLPDDPLGWLHTQGIVSNAFSIELYIKLLQVVRGCRLPLGHNYHDIFGKLPKDVQDRIGRKFCAYWLCADNNVEEYIAETGDWFVRLRYYYENLAVWKFGDASPLPPHFSKHKYWNLNTGAALYRFTVMEFAPHLDADGHLSSTFPPGNSTSW